MAQAVLAASPIDPRLKRYCGSAVANDPVADASTWADDIRSERNNGPWHYIDIPRGKHQGSLETFCGSDGCVTRAILEQLAIYKDKSADPVKRADALRYIIHFVGDLHQPLHAISNADSGGNCVPVRYFDYEPRLNALHPEREEYSPSLHQIWDAELVERDMEVSNPRRYADALTDKFRAKADAVEAAGIRVDDWAWESHERAEHGVYEALSGGIGIEPDIKLASCAENNHMGKRMFEKHLVVGEPYQRNAAKVIEESLWEAGVRLALVLNEAAKQAS
jgi:nuclease S1